MKKALSILTTVIIIFSMFGTNKVKALSFQPNQQVQSDSVIMYNIDTNTVVYEKKADARKYPAQLAQIMTAIIAIEKADSLERMLEVPENVYDEFESYRQKYPDEEYPYNEVTTAFIEGGEELSVRSLIYAMMLRSSCEAAVTLAYNIGEGSTQNFVNMMNAKAAEIGANDTHFTNPHGLFDEDQYTTARDMLKITQYALNVPGFSDIVAQKEYTTPAGDTFENVNVMMDENSAYYYQGTRGIKTGNSNQSGRCLASRATKDGKNYIIILMDAPLEVDDEVEFTHLEDAIMLYDWAFQNLEHQIILESMEEISTIKVNYAKGKDSINLRAAEDVMCMWSDNADTKLLDLTDIQYVYKELNAPVKAGEKLGVLTIRYMDNEVAKVDLVAYSDAELSQIKYYTALVESYFKSDEFKNAIKIALTLTFIYVIIGIYIFNKRVKERREKRIQKRKNENL